MIRLLVRTAIFLGSAALGLLVAMAAVDEMTIDWTSFLVVVVIFAVLQSVLAPFILRTTSRSVPALVGATGLLSTFISLLITSLFGGLTITGGPGPWLLASVIVWLVTMVGALLLPMVIVTKGARRAKASRAAGGSGTTSA